MLKNKIIIITGGSKGIGFGIAEALKRENSTVVIASRDKNNLENIANMNGLDYFPCDVTKEEEVTKLSQYVIEKYGSYDIWINNAGMMTKSMDFLETDVTDVKKMFEVNFFGYLYGAKESLKHFLPKNEGVLLNINSSSALEGKKDIIGYSASKYAVKGLTDGLEKYLSGKNILQINVYPGGVQTDLHKTNNPTNFQDYFSVEYVTKIIVDNLLKDTPEKELKILRNK